jgi:predicted cupin superfamily sugar epimerase
MVSVDQVISLLNLRPLPVEGGFYAETYRAAETIPAAALPARYGSDRPHGTAIYYFLTPELCSRLHRLRTDEVWHFYLGDPVELLQLLPDGTGQIVRVGTDLPAGQRPQVVVPRNAWMGARLQPGGAFALLGTTMAPGFDPADFELGEREVLLQAYPGFVEWVTALTPAGPATRSFTAPAVGVS